MLLNFQDIVESLDMAIPQIYRCYHRKASMNTRYGIFPLRTGDLADILFSTVHLVRRSTML
jgi:hypothetical protein